MRKEEWYRSGGNIHSKSNTEKIEKCFNSCVRAIERDIKKQKEALKENKLTLGPRNIFKSDEYLGNPDLSYEDTVKKFLERYPAYDDARGKMALKNWALEWLHEATDTQGKEKSKEILEKKKLKGLEEHNVSKENENAEEKEQVKSDDGR